MQLSGVNSQFIFKFPSDFIAADIKEKYEPVLIKNRVVYFDIVSYLNSTIMEISIPGLSISLPTYSALYGKKVHNKPALNMHDINSTFESDIRFRVVDGGINWFLARDIFMNHYLDTDNRWFESLEILVMDNYRDVVYKVRFRDIILTTLSEKRFSYSDNNINVEDFSVSFTFNFLDVFFELEEAEKQLILEKKLATSSKGYNYVVPWPTIEGNDIRKSDRLG